MHPTTANRSPSPVDILRLLKAETADEHEAIEAVVPLMRADLDWDVYRAYLARLYGFYEPFEARLGDALSGSSFATEFERRRKLPLLARDLLARGDTPADLATLPRCDPRDLPAIDDVTCAFGALYVLEGSTLGGRILTRHLTTALQADPARDCAFLSANGSDIGADWRAFGEAIEGHASALDTDDIDRLVVAARATFVSLRCWVGAESPR